MKFKTCRDAETGKSLPVSGDGTVFLNPGKYILTVNV